MCIVCTTTYSPLHSGWFSCRVYGHILQPSSTLGLFTFVYASFCRVRHWNTRALWQGAKVPYVGQSFRHNTVLNSCRFRFICEQWIWCIDGVRANVCYSCFSAHLGDILLRFNEIVLCPDMIYVCTCCTISHDIQRCLCVELVWCDMAPSYRSHVQYHLFIKQ